MNNTREPKKDDYYPTTDWGWYFVGATTAVIALAWGGAWLIDRMMSL